MNIYVVTIMDRSAFNDTLDKQAFSDSFQAQLWGSKRCEELLEDYKNIGGEEGLFSPVASHPEEIPFTQLA